MYEIALVNMPLANLSMPSLALTQLKAVVDKKHGDRVRTGVHYLNHDFALFYFECARLGGVTREKGHPEQQQAQKACASRNQAEHMGCRLANPPREPGTSRLGDVRRIHHSSTIPRAASMRCRCPACGGRNLPRIRPVRARAALPSTGRIPRRRER